MDFPPRRQSAGESRTETTPSFRARNIRLPWQGPQPALPAPAPTPPPPPPSRTPQATPSPIFSSSLPASSPTLPPPREERRALSRDLPVVMHPRPSSPFRLTFDWFKEQHNSPEGFVPKDFVRLLTRKLAPHDPQEGFNPKPYQEVFEAREQELLALAKQTDREIDLLVQECNQSESAYRAKLREMQTFSEEIMGNFRSLEESVRAVATTAVRIGDPLNTVDRQQKRAQEVKMLIKYFLEFLSPEITSPVFDVLTSKEKEMLAGHVKIPMAGDVLHEEEEEEEEEDDDEEGGAGTGGAGEPPPRGDPHEAAVIMSKLVTFARDLVEVEGKGKGGRVAETKAALDRVLRFVAILTYKLYKMFDKARERGRGARKEMHAVMKKCAETLAHFDDGKGLNAHYMQLVVRPRQGTRSYPDEELTERHDPKAAVATLYNEIRQTIEQEKDTIMAVFSSPELMVQTIIQHIITKRVSLFMDIFLRKYLEMGLLKYLQVLRMAYNQTKELADAFRKYEKGLLNMDQEMDNVFRDPHLIEYIDNEVACLRDLFKGEVINASGKMIIDDVKRPSVLQLTIQKVATRYSRRRQHPPLRTENGSASPLPLGGVRERSSSVGSGSSSTEVDDLADLSRLTTWDEKTAMDIVILYERHTEEAMERCKDLSHANDLPSNTFRIFRTLMDYLFQFLSWIVDLELGRLTESEHAREPPNPSFFSAVKVVDIAIQKLQSLLQAKLVARISDDPQLIANCMSEKRRHVADLEQKTLWGLGKALDIMNANVERTLQSEQKKLDFRPREENHIISTNPTPACVKVTLFIHSQHEMVKDSLGGKNLQAFLAELGNRLYNTLLNHIRKFTVNTLGGLMLMRDLAEYQQCVDSFKLPLVNERFAVLREIANLFVVAPENLPGLVEESSLGKMDIRDVHRFVQQRTDYKSSKVGKMLEDRFGPQAALGYRVGPASGQE